MAIEKAKGWNVTSVLTLMTWMRLLRRRGLKRRVTSLIGKMIFFLLMRMAVGLCMLLSMIAKMSKKTIRTTRNAMNWKQKVAMKLLLVMSEKLVVCIAMAPP